MNQEDIDRIKVSLSNYEYAGGINNPEEVIEELVEEVERLQGYCERIRNDLYREQFAHNRLKHQVAQHKSWGKQLH